MADAPDPDAAGDSEASDASEDDATTRARIERLLAKYAADGGAAWKAAVSARLLEAARGRYAESRDPMDGRGEVGPLDAEPIAAERGARDDAAILALLDGMIVQQRAKVLAIARRIEPTATSDDTLQPHDNPKLNAHPLFQFEDGILAGLLAAQTAIRARRGDAT